MNTERQTASTDVVSTDVVEYSMSFSRRDYYRSRLKKTMGNRDSPHASKLQGSKHTRILVENAAVESTTTVSQKIQKNLMKKEIQMHAIEERTKEAANATGSIFRRIVDKAEDVAGRIAETVKETIEEHPLGTIIALVIMLIIMVVSGALSSCSVMFSGINDAVITTSFTADDRDIIAVELDYRALEEALRAEIDNFEDVYPDYNEYRYSLDEIGHDPFELASLLTILYENYTEAGVQGTLPEIYENQYVLEKTEETEIRTRTETRWHYVTYVSQETRTGTRIVNGVEESYDYVVNVPYQVYEPYEVEVEYEYKILKVTLTNNGISAAVSSFRLNMDQMMRYGIILQLKGNKPHIFDELEEP